MLGVCRLRQLTYLDHLPERSQAGPCRLDARRCTRRFYTVVRPTIRDLRNLLNDVLVSAVDSMRSAQLRRELKSIIGEVDHDNGLHPDGLGGEKGTDAYSASTEDDQRAFLWLLWLQDWIPRT